MTLKELEKRVILQSYSNNNKSKDAVARELGISLRTVHDRFQDWREEDKRNESATVDQAAKDQIELQRHRFGIGKSQPGVLARELPAELTTPGKQDAKPDAAAAMKEAEHKAKAKVEKK